MIHQLVSDKCLDVKKKEITNIRSLKKGMTKPFICIFAARIKKIHNAYSGEGTDKMINRSQEYAVYGTIEWEKYYVSCYLYVSGERL